jgi:hypothetical protein
VDQALADMPEEFRTLLVEHFLLGKSQAQLAIETGQSASTISRRMQSALTELRKHLRLKGVYALPAALAALLCHVAARQAPASLVHELGKMSMYHGATAAAKTAKFGSPDPYNHPPAQSIASHIFSPIALAFAGMIGAAILLQLIASWLSWGAARPVEPEPHLKPQQASAMIIWGADGLGQTAGGGLLQRAMEP